MRGNDGSRKAAHLRLGQPNGRSLPDGEHQLATQLHRLLHVHLQRQRPPFWDRSVAAQLGVWESD
jgi:hypothetical protein